jgi:hypothetical protein
VDHAFHWLRAYEQLAPRFAFCWVVMALLLLLLLQMCKCCRKFGVFGSLVCNKAPIDCEAYSSSMLCDIHVLVRYNDGRLLLTTYAHQCKDCC